MLRPRKGLNALHNKNHNNAFSDNNENSSNNKIKISNSENMQGKHFTQSSNGDDDRYNYNYNYNYDDCDDDEFLAGRITPTGRTATTTYSSETPFESLLSQQQMDQKHRNQQQQHQHQHEKHHKQQGKLNQREFRSKHTHYTITSEKALRKPTERNYARRQLPGSTHWNTHNPSEFIPYSEQYAIHKQLQENPTSKSLFPFNSVRRIRRPRQWIYPQAPLTHSDNALVDSSEAGYHKLSLKEKCKAFWLEFLQGSSIHGIIYMAKFGLSIVERTIWFAFICVALFSIISLSHRTWERFQTSPMVISMDRNKLVWNTSFPSLTVCPHKRIDELKVEDYITEHEDDFPTELDKEDFRDFIEKLAKLTYENIDALPMNKTFGITSKKYLDLLYELKWNFEPEMSSGAALKMYIYETLTEFGICHSVNSLIARYNAYEYWQRDGWNFLEHGDRVTVHPLDGEIYAQIINLSTAYDVYFHGAGDIPSISKQRYTFPESDYTTVELFALEIYTAEDARAFSTKQRKCRFQYEAEEMLSAPIYSFGLCLAECRMFFALKICGCVPHFYRNRLKNGRILPICGFEGLTCLAYIKKDIISLKSDRYKINCDCLSNCDDSNFFVQSYRSRVWFLGANLQWGIIDYPKMQLRRDVLFSFADVLVYIGGLAGFFLGCSILSFTEVLYYFTIRFVRRIFCD